MTHRGLAGGYDDDDHEEDDDGGYQPLPVPPL